MTEIDSTSVAIIETFFIITEPQEADLEDFRKEMKRLHAKYYHLAEENAEKAVDLRIEVMKARKSLEGNSQEEERKALTDKIEKNLILYYDLIGIK